MNPSDSKLELHISKTEEEICIVESRLAAYKYLSANIPSKIAWNRDKFSSGGGGCTFITCRHFVRLSGGLSCHVSTSVTSCSKIYLVMSISIWQDLFTQIKQNIFLLLLSHKRMW